MAGGTFPTSLPTYAVTAGAETANGAGGGTGLSGLLNQFEVDITALATKLGSGAATPALNKVLVGNGAGTSTWATTLAGLTLTTAILTAPTIADFTNAQHAHTAASSGGLLPLFGGIAIQKFTANGTYTPNAKMIYCIIECWGGGGGGGNSITTANYNLYAAGGGSGAYSKLTATAATIGASKAVTIGAGGAGQGAAATQLQDVNLGGQTSVGTICIAKGGGNGGYVQGGLQVSSAGTGGSTTGGVGDIVAAGANGLAGFYSGVKGQDTQSLSGGGGGTTLGGAGTGQINAAGGAATANTGSGGAGGASYAGSPSSAGGNGATGYVLITEFLTL